MLRREEAEKQLQAFAAVPGRRRAPSMFRGSLATRLHRWADEPPSESEQDLARELDGLSPGKLARTFSAVAPALGGPLARWWVWAQAGPYLEGWSRRGFRTGRPEDSRSARLWQLWHLLRVTDAYPQDAAWFAAWLSHVPDYTHALGGLLASEISAGREDIAGVLVDSAFGRHPISGTTRSGLTALLAADRPEHWEQVTTLLRNAGRQEGLRSAVLEAVDLAHPDAFARILEVVVEEDLVRFAGTVRAAGVWFGEELTVRTSGELSSALAELRRALVDPGLAHRPAGPVDTYVRLVALAVHDACAAVPRATELLGDADPRIRQAAARALAEIGLPEARDALVPALADADLGVYATAVSAWDIRPSGRDVSPGLDDRSVEVLMERVRTLGKARAVDTGVVGSRVLSIGSAHAADVVLKHRTVSAAPAEAMAAASADGRWGAVRQLTAAPVGNRAALFGFFADPSSSVRDLVHSALDGLPAVTTAEAVILQEALRRKASDIRRHAIGMLLRQPPEAVAATVAALEQGTPEQVAAAGEIATRAGLAPGGQGSTDDEGIPASVRPGIADRTPAVRPTAPPDGHFVRYHAGCRHVLSSLQAWIDEHADVEVETWRGVELLANVGSLPFAPPGSPIPLPDIIGPWWERVGPSLTDGGAELLLLALAFRWHAQPWAARASAQVTGATTGGGASPLVREIVRLMARHEARSSWTDLALDATAAVLADLPLSGLHGPVDTIARLGGRMQIDEWGNEQGQDVRGRVADPADFLPLGEFDDGQLARLWRMSRFLDEPDGPRDAATGPRVQHRRAGRGGSVERVLDQPWRWRPPAELLCRAVDAGAAGRADLLDALLRPEGDEYHPSGPHGRQPALRLLSARRPPGWARSETVQSVVDEVRDAAVAGELARGELPGPLTDVAGELRSATGSAGVTAVLSALGRRPFVRGYIWTDSRESSLSSLVRVHQPAPGEAPGQLSAALAAARIPEKRVVEFGVYAPQWAGLVEQHLGWPGYESAVWWLHAHTKDDSWYVDQQIREEWTSAVGQRTPLDAVDLVRGGTDVEWFHRMLAELGTDRFERVLVAAKYASSSGGHKRSELFASALLGRVGERELLERIRAKRHQDSVRALGLLPLDGPHDPALLARYELLAGFVASDRTSGSQRRASESTAVAIGMENLARSAGYRDPGRLTWAMEAEAVRDLAAGPVTAADGDLVVTLSLTPDGAPQLVVERAGKVLRSIPSAAGKVPAIAELKDRVAALRRQAARMRRSLEASCVAGERFEPDELAELLRHPVLAPMLRTLVVVSDEGVTGFPGADPGALLGPNGVRRPVDGSPLRLAHPVDLLAGGEWPELQHEVFAARRPQPFRQLFRELYVPTPAETDDGPSSRRYAGQQVESRRAAGLFTARGWVADFEVGFGRTFHAEKITAWCSLLGGAGTAAEVEDATIEEVTFVRSGTWEVVPIADVPPRLFSETMRDLDLVVSVAHAGRVDPETSESTTEARRRMVEETVELLGLDNVEVAGHHARIRGKLGSYSVQLGSGVVHRVPGNAVCIIPVSAQHRGRIFLPFADDDPRTAEVISKVLLLARDDRIQDPTVLEQLV